MTITAVPPPASPYDRPAIVRQALDWLEGQVRQTRPLDSPTMVRDYLRLWLADRPHEVFAAVFLDAQHHVIDARELFRGSLSQTSVYPREVAVEALQMHAAALIVAHNHPSGSPEPSRADIALTQQLKACLGLLDIRLLDHFVVTRTTTVSFAERGLL
ncbi:DNA repair protein RadC [Xenophilus sp. Marseille-Q4582]|uniref:RadC family protein n=1 Tax=Xenophilus sp. Marseille-Q4582 TaxID=2866600 RepID=UPI00351D5B9F